MTAQDRCNFSRRLEPVDTVLHGVGQSHPAFLDYCDCVGEDLLPLLYMCYVGLKGDVAEFFAKLAERLADAPGWAVPQIGLSMTKDGSPEQHYEHHVAEGQYDEQIEMLCEGLAALGRPAFVRIGYEFSGQWNGYQPESYIAAYRRVAAALDRHRLADVATVWCYAPEAIDKDFARYYPGDDVVHWWAIDLFSVEHFDQPDTREFMANALGRRYPVMIGESTPRYVGVLAEDAWPRWFQRYFDFIDAHPHCKALSYIAWDWAPYPMWSDWGDGRIWESETIARKWRQQLARPLFAHGGGASHVRRTLQLDA